MVLSLALQLLLQVLGLLYEQVDLLRFLLKLYIFAFQTLKLLIDVYSRNLPLLDEKSLRNRFMLCLFEGFLVLGDSSLRDM